jgi:pimeloyl-ACP methyl ester carboxylesterase
VGRRDEKTRWRRFVVLTVGLWASAALIALGLAAGGPVPRQPSAPQASPVPSTSPSGVTPAVVSGAVAGSTVETSVGTVVVRPERPTGDVVVYFHGAGQTATTIVDDPETSGLVDALVADGYVVAARDAGGNSWGDGPSVRDYLDLVADLQRSSSGGRIFLVAESMGAVAAAQVAGRADVAAWVAIYPVCDLSTIVEPGLEAQIRAVYGAELPARFSPISWPDVPVATWASPDDTIVDAETNGRSCTGRVSGVFSSTVGEHGDVSNFDGPAVTAFFDAHR